MIKLERWPSWLKALAWKAGKRVSVSRVRIPLSPPLENFSVLDGEVAVPYNLQSAIAGLNSQSRRLYFGVCPK